MNAKTTALFLIGAFMGLGALAQEWTVYHMGNSPLPSTTVKALEVDGAGGVWIGTDWGLCHFDGLADWSIYQVGSSPLVGNNIRCLALGHDGRLWVGTESMGLQVKNGESWETFDPSNSPLPEYDIRDLFIAQDNAVWISTPGGLVRFDGTEWRIYDDTPESYGGAVLNTANTNTVAVREDGAIIMGSFNGGLHFIQGSSVEVLTSFEDNFYDNTAVDVAFHPLTGERWVATPAAGLLRQQGPLVGGLWTQWYGGIGFPTNATTSMSIDSAGDVWIGSHIAGLIRVKADGTYDQFTAENSGLPDNTVRSVLADVGEVWAGTFTGGLARYRSSAGVGERGISTLSAYPNPTSDRLTVQSAQGSEQVTWALYHINGALVRAERATGPSFIISVADLSAGPYFMEVRGNTSVERIKVFVD